MTRHLRINGRPVTADDRRRVGTIDALLRLEGSTATDCAWRWTTARLLRGDVLQHWRERVLYVAERVTGLYGRNHYAVSAVGFGIDHWEERFDTASGAAECFIRLRVTPPPTHVLRGPAPADTQP